jgi:beta-N-acetylhexosaminidase
MSLNEKIYQLFFVRPDALGDAGKTTAERLAARPVGGFVCFRDNIDTAEQITAMLSDLQAFSAIPLFVGVDEEGGRVARVTGRSAVVPEKIPPMATIGKTGDASQAFEVGAKLAGYIVELGFNVDFAPVADLLTNPKNNEIGDRSFGREPALVAEMVAREVAGLRQGGAAATLKHFPGCGSTELDSHDGYSESLRTLEELCAEEFLPFKAGIEAGAEFVMVAHMSAVNVDASGLPSSLSRLMVTDLLRNELGFSGIIITDSMSMGAITERFAPEEAAVLALEAGVDMLLMPEDLEAAARGVREAVATGRLTESRLDESVTRILRAKLGA